jgi:glycosyltransferase involved in cell wall biosynthesis
MKSNKRIAVFLQDLKGGGAEKMMVNLCNEFTKKGCQVDLLLVRKEGPYVDRLNDDINVISLNCKKVLFSLIPLIIYLRKYRPDAFLSTFPHVNIMAIIARKISGVKLTLVIREANNVELSKKNARQLSIRISYMLLPFFYRFADHIVAISEGLGKQLKRLIPSKKTDTHVIYNPVIDDTIDTMLQSPIPPGFEFIKNIKKPIIMGMGRLVPQKDFETLIKAFKIVREKKDASLVILGEGYLREELLKLAEDLNISNDVYLPGFTNNPYKVLSMGDIFVLSSRWEGFGNVLVEAMYCGLSVVSTDCPSGPSEILSGGLYGKLTPVGDADEIANELQYLSSISTNVNLHHYLSKFSLKSISTQYLSLLFK